MSTEYRKKFFPRQLNNSSSSIWDSPGRAIRSFSQSDASGGAASIAYYTLFSLFPRLLFLIAVGSYFVSRTVVERDLLLNITSIIPQSQDIIEKNIQKVIDLRGPVGIVALISLLWSATGVFSTLADHVSRAWPEAPVRNFLQDRLIALFMVGGVAILLSLSSITTAALGLLAGFNVPLWGNISAYGAPVWKTLASVIPWLIKVCAFFALYRWVPNTKVEWSAALGAALAAALGVEAITAAFTWYLRSGLVHYELVYGSLGTLVALMFWMYLGNWITLFGAHLSSAIAHRHS